VNREKHPESHRRTHRDSHREERLPDPRLSTEAMGVAVR
jgi:hypothetical protein